MGVDGKAIPSVDGEAIPGVDDEQQAGFEIFGAKSSIVFFLVGGNLLGRKVAKDKEKKRRVLNYIIF
ncbi:unnamed protein product [Ilex paraguariensis]|uniref:Uncharacterized protein n=1 Tax=Ilex paraguariensis TaxID=185542 RepID=A0ABC8UAJ4_9AQUA